MCTPPASQSHRRFAKFLKRDHSIEAKDVSVLEETIPPPAAPMPTAPSAASVEATTAPPQSTVSPASLGPGGRGRGRGTDLRPAWMTTGDLGQAPSTATNASADNEAEAKQAALAAELRALASESASGSGKKRKTGADQSSSVFADAEEAIASQAEEVDPAATKRAKGMAADFLGQLSAESNMGEPPPPLFFSRSGHYFGKHTAFC
eukprot:COSAG06_NODE_10436_length_1681_cov_1.539823_2_plen_206_part_00